MKQEPEFDARAGDRNVNAILGRYRKSMRFGLEEWRERSESHSTAVPREASCAPGCGATGESQIRLITAGSMIEARQRKDHLLSALKHQPGQN
jgi:hypothetical protein